MSALAPDMLRDAVANLPPNRLANARQKALEHLLAKGLPTTRDEDWKYTDLESVFAFSNAWLEQAGRPATGRGHETDTTELRQGIEAVWLVVSNGIVDPSSLETARAAGLDVGLLSDSNPDIDFSAPLADLNAALLVDGIRIRIDRRSAPSKPVGILIADDADTGISVTQTRVEIDAGSGCAVDVIEYHASQGAAGHYANSVIEATVGTGATVNYTRLQARAEGHSQTGRLSVRLDRDALFRHAAYDLGGGLVRNDLLIDIAGAGAEAEFAGLYLAGDKQHVDNHTRVDHRVGPARSLQEYRGVAAGNGRCVWNGKAIVHPGADGTDAEQANHNLLLSDGAEIDAKPELEIYADDVKCSHGTTVGQLDRNALYYLRTRGLARRDAERLLTQAFAQSMVDKCPVAVLAERVHRLVGARLASLIEEADA